jgi:hypothetical protein
MAAITLLPGDHVVDGVWIREAVGPEGMRHLRPAEATAFPEHVARVGGYGFIADVAQPQIYGRRGSLSAFACGQLRTRAGPAWREYKRAAAPASAVRPASRFPRLTCQAPLPDQRGPSQRHGHEEDPHHPGGVMHGVGGQDEHPGWNHGRAGRESE